MRRLLIFTAALALSAVATAGELDRDNATPLSQMELAKTLPKTTVVRVNKKTHKIEIAQLPYRLEKGQLPKGLKFSQVDLKSRFSAVPNNGKENLNDSSSNSAYGFGYGARYGYNYGPRYRHGRYPYSYRGRYPYAAGYFPYDNLAYGYPQGGYGYQPYEYSGCGGYSCGPWAYPVYMVSSYYYQYRPYWGFASAAYDYYYCGGPDLY